jgi:hypothetical protein
MYLAPMQQSAQADYDFHEDIEAEAHIRALLRPQATRPRVRFREPEELLRPYTRPKLRNELIREDFPGLARPK